MASMVKALPIPKGAPKRLAKSRVMGLKVSTGAPKRLPKSRVMRANTSTKIRKMSNTNGSPLRKAASMRGY